MSSTVLPAPKSATRREVAAWAAVVVLTQWFALLGLPIALVLAFTRLRNSPPVARWGLVVLASAILVLQVVGLVALGDPVGHVSTPHRVN